MPDTRFDSGWGSSGVREVRTGRSGRVSGYGTVIRANVGGTVRSQGDGWTCSDRRQSSQWEGVDYDPESYL